MKQFPSLRKRFKDNFLTQGVLMPGVFNALSAKVAQKAGFKALYISGASLTASAGVPDIGLLTLTEWLLFSRYIVNAVDIPCVCDVDTGFGGLIHVSRTVQECEALGLAGIHIEDQISPKRCGHLSGKEVIPIKEMCQKIHAAVLARSDPNFLIIARTDARTVEGFDSAIERAKAYSDAGADVIFPEALNTPEEFEQFAQKVNHPLLANMTEFGVSPMMTFQELTAMGYKLVIFPVSALRVAMKSVQNFYDHLLKTGSQIPFLNAMQTRNELYDLVEYQKYADLDEKVARF